MRRVDLETSLLRCFVAVVDAGGLTAAAGRIGLTQSGISVRLRRLEELLGRRVLVRNSRSLRLTPDGEILLEAARLILELNDRIVNRLVSPELEGPLRVGIADYLAPQRLPGLLSRFSNLYPRVHLDIRTGLGLELLPLFQQGQLDLVVAGSEEGMSGGIPILEEPLIWVAAASYAVKPDHPLTMAALPLPCSHRRAGTDALRACGRELEVVFTSSSVAGIQAAVRAGLGIAVLPASAVTPDMRVLGAAEGLPPLPQTSIAAFSKGDAKPGIQEALVAFLRQEFHGTEAAWDGMPTDLRDASGFS